jgi:ribonuclease BN (tRNA processing enzyme)
MPFTTGTKLILLGTKGGPRVTGGRANPSNVVMLDGEPLVVDCGYGVTRQLVTAGIQPQQVRKILITHHHSDHILELGPLIYNVWIAGVHDPIDVWGPPPLRQIIDGFFQSMAYDIGIRIEDEDRVDLRQLVRVHEFKAPCVLAETAGGRISVAKVRHPPLAHAYAYRFDAPDRSIVLSGDTRYCHEMIDLAQGADVLLHEVMNLDAIERLVARVPNVGRLREHLLAAHTTTTEVGKIAAAAGVKTLVLNHFVPGDDPAMTDDVWREDPAKDFAGSVIVGRDLQAI